MAERDTPQTETAEQLGQLLLEFVDKAEFGTAHFRAVSDYFDLQALYDYRKSYVEILEGDLRNKVHAESTLRVHETKIALLEHQIEQNKSQLPGYSGAYQHMETALEDIHSLAWEEAGKMHTEIEEQRRYVMRIWQVAYDGAHEIISMKKDTS
jgi:hypothetical protein